MRTLPVLLLVALMIPIPVIAQDAPALLEDPEGDVQIHIFDSTTTAAPSGLGEQADLRFLRIEEDRTDLTFTVGLASVDTAEEISLAVNVLFQFNGRDMGLRFNRFEAVMDGARATLYQTDPGSGFSYAVEQWPAIVDEAAATLAVEVPRNLIVDMQGNTPGPGTSLTGIHVTSDLNQFFSFDGEGSTGSLQDKMGTDAPAELPILMGLEQTGHARLHAATPFRASNGEATTFVFEVEASNLGTESDIFSLKVLGAPNNWEVTTPTQNLRLEPNETQTVPVVVRTAFVHAHGKATAFVLAMHSETDPGSIGRVELGVRYPEIPQPAGHHDTLWLHSYQAGNGVSSLSSLILREALLGSGTQDLLTMNGVENDDADDGIAVKGNWCGNPDNSSIPFAPLFCWPVYLAPGLEMGLDFDLSREGSISFPVHSLIPAPHRIQGQLLWQGPLENPDPARPFQTVRETIVLANLVGDWTDIGLNGQAILEARIVATPEADLIEYTPGTAFLLDLQVAADRPDNFFLGPKADKPDIMPGGSLQLPLLEYEDPVGDVFDAGGLVSLRADVQEKLVNPGKTVVFNVTVENLSPRSETYVARLVGSNEAWGSILGSTRISMAGNGSARLSIAVTAPEDAADGDRADLLLEVASTRDLDGRGLIRLVTTVDTDAEHPDEATTAKDLNHVPNKKSPGAPLEAVLVACAALAVLRRRF